MIFIPPHPVEENIASVREIFEAIAKKRTNIFKLRTLRRENKNLDGNRCNHHIQHLLKAGLLEYYDYSVYTGPSGTSFRRNIIYKRNFDSSVDIDKWMEVMIANDVSHSSGCRVSHLR